MAQAISASRFRKASLVASRVIQGILAVMFVEAVVAKLIGAPPMIQVFDAVGFGQWFRFFTAAAEAADVIALLTPGLAAFGALWLGGIIFFATLTHLLILHTSAVGRAACRINSGGGLAKARAVGRPTSGFSYAPLREAADAPE